MATGDVDINTNPGCSWATSPDMALGSSGLDDIMARGRQCQPLRTAWPWHSWGTNMAIGDNPSPRHLCDLWWQHRSWTSAQTPNAVGIQIQTMFSAADQLGITMTLSGTTVHSDHSVPLAFASSVVPLPTAHELLCFSFSPMIPPFICSL